MANPFDSNIGGPINQPFANLRMQNLFPPQDPIQPGPQTFGAAVQGVPISPEQSPFQPQPYNLPDFDTRAQERLYALLGQFPHRNQPGIGRKIISSIAGFGGGSQLADQMMYAPYYQKLQDWNAQFGPTEKVAQEERLGNVNLRSLAYNIAQDRNYQERLRIQDADERRKEISTRAYAAFKQFQMDHPGFTIEAPKGGNYQLFNKATGQRVDSGYPTGTLDRLQEMEFQRETNKQVAAVPRTVTTSGTTTTTTSGPTPEDATQEKARKYVRARDLSNKYPELAPYIHLDVPEPGTFTVTPPSSPRLGGMIGGADKHQWQLWNTINRYIESGELDPDTQLSTDKGLSDKLSDQGKTSTSISNRRSVTSRELPQQADPNKPKATTDKLKATIPAARSQSQYSRQVESGIANSTANRAVESQQGAERRAAQAAQAALTAKRQRAVQILQNAGESTDEASIKAVMDQLK